jgi:hypothetical protein
VKLATVLTLAAAILSPARSASMARTADPTCVSAGPYYVDNQQVVPYVQQCIPTA